MFRGIREKTEEGVLVPAHRPVNDLRREGRGDL